MKIGKAKATAILFATVLTGCGRGEDTTSAQNLTSAQKPYLEQSVAWLPCDKTSLGGYADVVESSRLRCANIRTPMDWSNPARGDITVAVTRIAVKDPAKRKGSLLFNPGGPGADALTTNVEFLSRFVERIRNGTATSGERQLIEQFDLIGFSPRGMGSSTQLTCGSNERRTNTLWAGDTSKTVVDGLLRNVELESKACQKNPLTPYINTDQTARDMNLIRVLLGDAKLNYLGHSYGTWLGAWYAALFPEQTGRMVLSSNADFSASNFPESGAFLQPWARQRIIEQIIGPYAARHDTYFNLGSNPAGMRQLFMALPPALKTATSHALDASYALNDVSEIDKGVSIFVASKGVQQLLKQHPNGTQEQILALVKQHVFSRHERANQMARDVAMTTLVPTYFELKQQPLFEEQPLHMPTDHAVIMSVICNDTPALSTDRQFWIDKHTEDATAYPLHAGSLFPSSCLFWKPTQPTLVKPTIDKVARTPSIVMVQAQFDGFTPAESALRMFDRLPNARLIYIKNEYTHADYPYGTPCVDDPVTRYLLDGTLPPRRADCEGKTLWLDAGHELEYTPNSASHDNTAGSAADKGREALLSKSGGAATSH
ncbi:alpha/beta fold hydrolase [Paraburkholderia fungorum]|uniref:alpha/beta fold hydrolase n=1 Tax=Paraburkholderia fungorum TaxID=134537 RepID=UPI0038B7BE66